MYYNDKYGSYLDINPHHQSGTVQLKTKGSFVYPTPEEARQLAKNLVEAADRLEEALTFVLEVYDAGSSTGQYYLLRADKSNPMRVKDAIRRCSGITELVETDKWTLLFEDEERIMEAMRWGEANNFISVGSIGPGGKGPGAEPNYLSIRKAEVGELMVDTDR